MSAGSSVLPTSAVMRVSTMLGILVENGQDLDFPAFHNRQDLAKHLIHVMFPPFNHHVSLVFVFFLVMVRDGNGIFDGFGSLVTVRVVLGSERRRGKTESSEQITKWRRR